MDQKNDMNYETKKVGFCKLLFYFVIYKYRLCTPFTTDHPRLSRGARGIINTGIIFSIWALSGIIVDFGDELPKMSTMFLSLIFCFIWARLATFAFEMLMMKTRKTALIVIQYIVGILIVLLCQALVIVFSLSMGDEYKKWVWVVLATFFMDLFVWELVSSIA
jgi:hypothetical protein